MVKEKKRKLKNEVVGFAAVTLGVIAFMPLLWNTFSHKSTHSLHYGWLALRLAAASLWIWFAMSNQLVPNMVSAAIAIAVFIVLISVKIYWEGSGQAMHQNALKGTYAE